MHKMSEYNVSKLFSLCYSDDAGAGNGAGGDGTGGDGNDAGGDGASGDGTGAAKKTVKTLTQEEVNKILAKERREHQVRTQKAIDDLNALKSKVTITSQEREQLEARIEEMQASITTKEELARQNLVKATKAHEAEIKKRDEELATWKNRYTESTIGRALTDAAIEHKALVPLQIAAILRPTTRLVEAVDAEGKPTGTFEAKVKLDDVNDKGEPVTLDLTVTEAVKRMREMELHQNLFQGDGTGGLGSTNRNKKTGAKTTLAGAAKSGSAAYREARKSIALE